MTPRFARSLLLLTLLLGGASYTSPYAFAQAVNVTLRLDTNTIGICDTTVLRVYAQVAPVFRPGADRIFSWYIDVLNTNSSVVYANYGAMLKTASDKDPQTSSTGFSDGAHRRGIYDTFLNLLGAGVTSPVELLAIPLTGQAAGRTRFRIQHGTGIPNLSDDFIVAPRGGGDLLTGGDYSAAFIDLNVTTNATTPRRLSVAHEIASGGSNKLTIRFDAPVAGCDCFLEYRNQLGSDPNWQSFPAGPHNSGIYRDTNQVPTRFYRLRAMPTGR